MWKGDVRLILLWVWVIGFCKFELFNDFVFYLMDKWYGYYFIVNVV